jgi:hypothetical protein
MKKNKEKKMMRKKKRKEKWRLKIPKKSMETTQASCESF